MKSIKRNSILISSFALIISTSSWGNISPSEELLTWQNKYPGNAYVSIAKTQNITINYMNNILETTIEHYNEWIILSENTSFLADSKEYFNNHYTIKKLEAYSLVPDAKTYKKLPVSNFKKSVEIDDYVFYDDQLVYSYTYPSVGKGTKLITRSVATTNYEYVPIVFDFGGYIPNENLSVTLSCPKNLEISYRLFGNDTSIIKYTRIIKGDRILHSWSSKRAILYPFDEKAPDSRYFTPHLVIHISKYIINGATKRVMGSLDDLYEYNYSHISSLSDEISPELKRLADSITFGCVNEQETVKNIFKWVQKHIKYVAIEDGNNGLIPSEASQVLKKRYGDCKGKTSLLVAMIKSQGLKASYAWVGSRARPYKFSEFPSVICSDHMIAVWWEGDKPVILDGTTYSHQMHDIPAFIQGKECLIEKGKNQFTLYTIPVTSPEKNKVIDSVDFKIRGNEITGSGRVTLYGENKAKIIGDFDGRDTSFYRTILQRNLSKASNKHIIKSVTISDPGNIENPFVINYTFLLSDFITISNNRLYVSLNLDRFLQDIIINRDRTTPFENDMTMEYQLHCRLTLPEGYKAGKLPDSTFFNHPLFSFNEKYSLSNEQIFLDSTVKLNFHVIEGPEMNQFREMILLLNRNYLKSIPLEKTETL